MQLYLASQSPRRRKILEDLGLRFGVLDSAYHEVIPPGHPDPPSLAREYALRKWEHLPAGPPPPGLVITADTLVYLGERVFGKPVDEPDARRMITALAGRSHRVVTGLCLHAPDRPGPAVVSEVTAVRFDRMSAAAVDRYLAHGDWRDKAGAYAIQGYASLFIREIRGCYFNVVGFPVNRFFRTLASMGIPLDAFDQR
ncbi:MAG: septum formation protein Maf [Acidobacteria bacterium]|nr:septum formation protein Maf [Acidobacteriota bacterium]